MKILTWNVNSIKSLKQYYPWNETASYSDLFNKFGADILCFQELKLQRSNCPATFAMAPGWDMYASFCTAPKKGGYSGVSTHVKNDGALCMVPLDAEDGFTGVSKRLATHTLKEIGSLENNFSKAELLSFDEEGRCVVTDHGLFILLNVYFPNEASDRLEFKMQFHRAIEQRIRQWIADGRDVIIVGDINACHKPIDHCDPEQSIRERGIEHFEDTRPRQWIESIVGKNGIMIDLFRVFHANERGCFTCWNTKTNARPSNYGTRIDYILCTPRLQAWFKDCKLLQNWMGSDHCPVVAELHAIHPTTKVHLSDAIGRLHVNGKSTVTSLPEKPPKLASRYWSEFQQKKLHSFFTNPKTDASTTTDLLQRSPKRNSASAKDTAQQGSTTDSLDASVRGLTQHGKRPQKVSLNEENTKTAWRAMFTAPPPPKCYHEEDAKELSVSKPGPNKGRQFYMCGRPIGPSAPPEPNGETAGLGPRKRRQREVGEYQCSFFQWKKQK